MTKGHAMTQRDPSETDGATNASADNNTRTVTETVGNLKWTSLIQGNYPKRTTEEGRETLDAARVELDVYDIAIAAVIASHWNKSKGYAHPGHRRIADCAKVNKSTVPERVEKMERLGWLRVERRMGRAGWRYYLLAPAPTMSGLTGQSEGGGMSGEMTGMSGPTDRNVRPHRTELTELEKELHVTAYEEPDLRTFLNTIADKLDTTHRHKLTRERAAPGNRPTLKAIHARIGNRPSQRARDIAQATDINNADRSILRYLLAVMDKTPEPTTPRQQTNDCPRCHGTGFLAEPGAGATVTTCTCQTTRTPA